MHKASSNVYGFECHAPGASLSNENPTSKPISDHLAGRLHLWDSMTVC